MITDFLEKPINIKEISKPKRKIIKLIETICGPKTITVEV